MNGIMADYEHQGFKLSVRQRYYQLVTRNEIANSERDYERIIRLCNDARLSGLMDWDILEDRTREFINRPRWQSGAEIMRTTANSYHQDCWANQAYRVFCVVEKDALSGVLQPTCQELDIPLLTARGYPFVTVLREFAVNEIIPAMRSGQVVIILHLGDHDPSGIDMSRDLYERLLLFLGESASADVSRIALNMDQVEELNPPENPAKTTDKRFGEYAKRYGTASWELDALPPDYLARLIREYAEHFIDPDLWAESMRDISEVKASLSQLSSQWQASHGE
jgi:hypothetical protein